MLPFKRFRKRAPKASARKNKGPRVPRKKAVTKLIKQVMNRELETKYVAYQAGMPATTGAYIVNYQCSPNTDGYRVLPQLAQQTTAATSNVREGDSIKPSMVRVSGHVWLTSGERTVPALDIYVKLWVLTAKEAKTYTPQVGTFPQNFPTGFLENGGPNPVDWQAPAMDLQAFYPISKGNYTVLRTKTFRLIKNPGATIGGTINDSNDPNIGRDRLRFSYTLDAPTLKYNTDSDLYPTNYAPIMLITYYIPGVDISQAIPLQGLVQWDYNTEMYFKDA